MGIKGQIMDRRSALKLVGAGGCGMAGLLATHYLLKNAQSQPSTSMAGQEKHRFGLFDVDSRELNTAGTGLMFRPRVVPLTEQLNRLYALGDDRRLPLVFTTCCSGRMLGPRSVPEVLLVPLDGAERKWEEQLPNHRLFCMQKKTYNQPGANFTCRAFDMFKDNGNAARLVQSLNVAEWIVFGNGFDFCISSAVYGLLAAGQKVCLLSDVYVQGARGYYVETSEGQCESGTAENRARILADFDQIGVRSLTLDQFLAST
jgi:hypothetical protein